MSFEILPNNGVHQLLLETKSPASQIVNTYFMTLKLVLKQHWTYLKNEVDHVKLFHDCSGARNEHVFIVPPAVGWRAYLSTVMFPTGL